MAQPADAVHCDDLSGARTGIAQRVVDRNARTHEGSRFLRRQFIWNSGQSCHRCDHVLGIPTVEIDAGHFSIDAHCEVTTAALFAHETMSAMPADTDALTCDPCCDVATDCIDVSSYFMTWHAWILKPGPETFFHER